MLRARRARSAARDWVKQAQGTAGVEFALILPLMLLLFFGGAAITQGMRASRKVEILAGTLANITGQQLTCQTGGNQPCLTDNDLSGANGVFTAAAALMVPYKTTDASGVLLRLTVSQVTIAMNNGVLRAKVDWTVTNGGGQPRPCNGGGPNGSLQAGIVSSDSPDYPNYLPPGYTALGAATGSMIVADVKYTYKPGYGYQFFKWADTTTGIPMASVGKPFFNRSTTGGVAGPIMLADGVANSTKCT